MHFSEAILGNYMERGFTIFELVVVLGISAVMMTIGITNLRSLEDPLEVSVMEVQSFFKLTRARAISTTSAFTIVPVSRLRLETRVSETCGEADPDNDETLFLNLPDGTSLESTAWSVCYSSRGIADNNVMANIQDGRGNTKWVEVLLGGATDRSR